MKTALFDAARDALKVEDLAEKLGVKLKRAGREQRGECPLCGGGKGSSRFAVKTDKQTWRCYGCGKFGDVVDLYAQAHRLSEADAAREIAGPGAASRAPPLARDRGAINARDQAAEKRALDRCGQIWNAAQLFWRSPGETYLKARGVSPAIVELIGPSLRFHPAAPHHWNGERWICAPALVARVITRSGPTGGLHLTYLRADFAAKAAIDPPKKMLGPQRDAEGRAGGVMLVGEGIAHGDMVVGEGIETSLALASWLHAEGKRDLRVCAALSLDRLQGGLQRDSDGCVDVWRPTGDPASTPFLWPQCNTAPTDTTFGVWIAIDRDMSPQKLVAKNARGRRLDVILDAEARAKLCALLAGRAWKAEGWAFARCAFPRLNGDWADLVSSEGLKRP